MEKCKFSYYKKEEKTERYFLYCNKTNNICPFVRFCNDLDKIVNVDNYKICNEYNKNNIPIGKNKVRFLRNGKLTVELYNKKNEVESCIEIENPFNGMPKFVELVKLNNTYYIKGYEPKAPYKK